MTERGVGTRMSDAERDQLHALIREIATNDPDLHPAAVHRRVEKRGISLSSAAFYRHFALVFPDGRPQSEHVEAAQHGAVDDDEPSHMIRCDTPDGFSVANPHGDGWQININISTDQAGALQLHELATRLLLGQGVQS